MTTNTTNELHEGDRVRIKKGMHTGEIGEIQTSGHAPDGTPIYLITILRVYKGDEIERVTPEESRGVV